LTAETIHQLRVGAAGERQSKHRARSYTNEQDALIAVDHRRVIIRHGG
jgi:hypothetical protein